jgi:hypothetical protein
VNTRNPSPGRPTSRTDTPTSCSSPHPHTIRKTWPSSSSFQGPLKNWRGWSPTYSWQLGPLRHRTKYYPGR